MQRNEVVRESLKNLLEDHQDEKLNFEATFKNFSKTHRGTDTALLLNLYLIKRDGTKELLTDHVWVEGSKRWNPVREVIRENDIVTFSAELTSYNKEGLREFFVDYGLKKIRNIQRIENE